jgi:hypothetical protein
VHWRKLYAIAYLAQNFIGYQDRFCKVFTAVNYAMAYGIDVPQAGHFRNSRRVGRDPAQNGIEG